jgi:hypothetical protein
MDTSEKRFRIEYSPGNPEFKVGQRIRTVMFH